MSEINQIKLCEKFKDDLNGTGRFSNGCFKVSLCESVVRPSYDRRLFTGNPELGSI